MGVVIMTFELNTLPMSAFFLYRTEKMAGILFEDIFDVKDIDPDGKKFERGSHY